MAAPASGDRWPCLAGLKDSYKPLTRVPTFGEAPRDSKREICDRLPAQDAVYNLMAKASRSSGEMLRGDLTAESTRGDLGGVIVVGRDVCLFCGNEQDVGEVGGLQ